MLIENKKKDKLEYEAALELLLAHTKRNANWQTVPLIEAFGRIAAKDIIARMEQPPFDRSPLDGYALLSGDTAGACKEQPVSLAVVGKIFAGDGAEHVISSGQAYKIMTGAKIPQGADCVIRQEDVALDGDCVLIPIALKRQENICLSGEDVPSGQVIISKGERVSSAHVGILAAQGVVGVQVLDKPVIGLLSTGSELVDLGSDLGRGCIFDSNSYMLLAELYSLGADVHRFSPQADDTCCLLKTVEELWEGCEAVITTGGVSVGEADLMPEVAKRLGGKLLFQSVNIRPGTPLLALERGGKLLLALSGNPFAAMATFALFAIPMVNKLSGLSFYDLARQKACITHDYINKGKARRFVRAAVQGGNVSVPDGNHSPGALFRMLGCNCLIDIPAGVSMLNAGDMVDIIHGGVGA